MERIDSAANKKLKLISKLHNNKFRKQEGAFVAEGVRLVEMAVSSSWQRYIQFVLVTDEALKEERVQNIIAVLNNISCPVFVTTQVLYKKASDTVSPQGILAVIENRILKDDDLDDLLHKENPLLIVLDGVQDPGNAGTIIRTADAAGFSGVICLENTVDILSDKVVRSSMGSLFNLPIAVGIEAETLAAKCREYGVKLFATALDETAVSHFAANYKEPVAIIMGNEGNGVSKELLSLADKKIFIPMSGRAESLNVSVAAAIMIYEAYRQRN